MAISGVYCIYNTINERSYVGCAMDIGRRWGQHKRHLRRGCHHSVLLQRSWDKYGPSAFVFVVLENVEADGLYAREQYWIDNLMSATAEHGFNISPSAGGSNLGRKLTAEHRAKIAAGIRGKKRVTTPEGRAKLRAARRGRNPTWLNKHPKTAEHRAKLSAALSGRKHSPEQIEKRRQGWKARFGDKTPEYIFRAAEASKIARQRSRVEP